jgi:hypothetical protein
VHAARLHDNWYSKRPKATRAIEFKLSTVDGQSSPSPVHQVLFLPGRNGELLLTLAGGVITAWEVPLDGSGAYCIAETGTNPHMPVQEMIANEDPCHKAAFGCRVRPTRE